MSEKNKKVVVIGGGFGGLKAARVLAKEKNIQVTLLDRRNHHLFQPLLYQVAMAGLSPADIAMPIRSVFSRKENAAVYLADVNKVDFDKQIVFSDIGEHSYDYLVLACGASHSYFGHENWEPFAPGLKTIEQATEIRRRVLMAFERAESLSDKEEQRAYLTFVVIGGGPTGVELAGAIGEISKYTLDKDFRHIDPSRTRIILIEAGPRILPSFSQELSRKACRALEKLGVQIWTSSLVTDVRKEGVFLNSEFVNARTILWAAGVEPAPLNKNLSVNKDKRGRILVEEDLSIPGMKNVFCVGDQACFVDKNIGNEPLPGVAPVAIQQGQHAAKNILADLNKKPRNSFHYFDKGQLATIGRRMAIMEVGKLKSFGFVAWLAWLFVHIYYLIGFKNRVFVFWQWTWHYLSYRRGARLIIHKKWEQF